jgi:hypothetical protein
MELWPAYKLDDVANMTPEQIIWHLEKKVPEAAHPERLVFATQEDYERWLAKTTS